MSEYGEYEDQQFLTYTAKLIVDHPDDVEVTRRIDEMGVLLTLKVNPADVGYVVGRVGNTAKALRTLLRIIGMQHNARVNLKIDAPPLPMREGTVAQPFFSAESDNSFFQNNTE